MRLCVVSGVTVVVHDPAVFIEDFELFDGFTAIQERSQGLERVRLLKADGQHTDVAADEPAYSMGLSENPEPDNPWLRYTYTSLTTPATTYEFNVRTGERRQLKQQPVIGYDPSQYVTGASVGDCAGWCEGASVAGVSQRF